MFFRNEHGDQPALEFRIHTVEKVRAGNQQIVRCLLSDLRHVRPEQQLVGLGLEFWGQQRALSERFLGVSVVQQRPNQGHNGPVGQVRWGSGVQIPLPGRGWGIGP